MNVVLLAVGFFTAIWIIMVSLIIIAKATLLPSGDIKLVVNKKKSLSSSPAANCWLFWLNRAFSFHQPAAGAAVAVNAG